MFTHNVHFGNFISIHSAWALWILLVLGGPLYSYSPPGIRCALNGLMRTHKLGLGWQVPHWCTWLGDGWAFLSCSGGAWDPSKEFTLHEQASHAVTVCEGLWYYKRESNWMSFNVKYERYGDDSYILERGSNLLMRKDVGGGWYQGPDGTHQHQATFQGAFWQACRPIISL